MAIDVDDVQSNLKGINTVGVGQKHNSLDISTVTGDFERKGKLVKDLVTFGTEVKAFSQKVLHACEESDNKEIKAIYQVKDARHNLVLAVEFAYVFLDKVDDIFYYGQSNSMAAAREGLNCSSPDLKPVRDLMDLLGESLEEAESKYSELVKACTKASNSCRKAAEVCACKEKEFRNKKGAAKGIGGTVAGTLMAGSTAAAAGGVVAGGVLISAVAGAFTAGTGTIVGLSLTAAAAGTLGLGGLAAGVGTAVGTHHLAKKYKESEGAFENTRRKFDDLLSFAHVLKEEVAGVHTRLASVSEKVNSVKNKTDTENINLIEVTLERLNKVFTISYATTSRCRDEVKSKLEELEAKVK